MLQLGYTYFISSITNKEPPSEHAFQVTELQAHGLPQGWSFDGYFHLDKRPRDYWEVKAGCLIRHHLVP